MATIVPAYERDIPEILRFIRDLAVYEKLEREVECTPDRLREHLFGATPRAEVVFALTDNGEKAGFALYFHSFSTFLGKPGIYLEDLYVKPEYRGCGYGQRLLAHLARLTVDRGCGRLEWSVLDWNSTALEFYSKLGAKPMSEWTVQRLEGLALTKLAQGPD